MAIVPNEQVEALVRGMLLGFESFGGVPLQAVFDNPKTIVTARKENRIEWNATFAQVALNFRFGIELCTPRRGHEKGSVENLVGWVKGSLFKVRRFHDREDLQRQLQDEWHEEVNVRRPSRATGVTPASRIEEERKRLRPLVVSPQEYALRFPVVAGPTGMVSFQGYLYSMPAEAIGVPATLFLYPDRVKIVGGRWESEHPRIPPNGTKISRLPEDAASMLASVSGKTGKLYLMRQQLLELGEDVEKLLTEIVHRRSRTWRGDVEKLHFALTTFGPERLLRAVRRALKSQLYGGEYVMRLIHGWLG